ncbi:MAG: hypothetical protein KC431_30055 [Myxococcales bacterium]|nr:hypothetical protein [Myxococcales bacterium]
MFERSTRRCLALLFAVTAGLTLGACRPPTDPSAPLEGHLALCCKVADDDNVGFRGCREDPCRTGESVWLRGPVTCTPVSEACLGGRCCRLVVPADDNGETPDVDIGKQGDLVDETDTQMPQPEPAPIVPMPMG